MATSPSSTAEYRRAVRHEATGYRPPGCRCSTCVHDPGPRTWEEPKPRKPRADNWIFERFAVSPRTSVIPLPEQTVVSVCCERETHEYEGGGHFDCPGKAS
jgi:hypothetical protein